MKLLTATEFSGLALGMILFIAGLAMIIWPQPGLLPHSTNDALGMRPRTELEFVTKSGSRGYGVVAVLLGAGIAMLSVYRDRAAADH